VSADIFLILVGNQNNNPNARVDDKLPAACELFLKKDKKGVGSPYFQVGPLRPKQVLTAQSRSDLRVVSPWWKSETCKSMIVNWVYGVLLPACRLAYAKAKWYYKAAYYLELDEASHDLKSGELHMGPGLCKCISTLFSRLLTYVTGYNLV